jgi:hypothetical protein
LKKNNNKKNLYKLLKIMAQPSGTLSIQTNKATRKAEDEPERPWASCQS